MTKTEYIEKIKRDYNIDIDAYMRLFTNSMSQEDMASVFGVTRKVIRTVGYKLGLDWADRGNSFSNLENRAFVTQAEKLKYKLALLTKKYNKLKQEFITKDEWYDRLLSYLSDNPQFIDIHDTTDSIPIQKAQSTIDYVLLLSDWHVGQKVNTTETHNTFNMEIATERINKVKDFLSIQPNSARLSIFLLGDFIESGIHDDLLSNEEDIFKYLFFIIDAMVEIINTALSHYDFINLYSVAGNHGRLKKIRYYKSKYVTLDSFIYGFLEYIYKDNKRVNITLSKENMGLVTIQKHKIAYTHGDILRSSGETDIDVLQSQMQYLYKENANTFLLGHFHKPLIRANNWGGYTIINGSLIGVDEFALFSNLRLTQPSQLFFAIIGDKLDSFKYIYL